MKPSLRAILSLLFILIFSFGMMTFGQWVANSYTDSNSVLFLTTVLSIIGASITWAIWNLQVGLREETRKRTAQLQDQGDNREKRKRDRIDSVLRNLSNEDLIRLRERLIDGTVDDDILYEQFVDDENLLVEEH